MSLLPHGQDYSPELFPKAAFEGCLERKHHYQVPLGSVLDQVESSMDDLGGAKRLLEGRKLHREATLDLLITIIAIQYSKFQAATSPNSLF